MKELINNIEIRDIEDYEQVQNHASTHVILEKLFKSEDRKSETAISIAAQMAIILANVEEDTNSKLLPALRLSSFYGSFQFEQLIYSMEEEEFISQMRDAITAVGRALSVDDLFNKLKARLFEQYYKECRSANPKERVPYIWGKEYMGI